MKFSHKLNYDLDRLHTKNHKKVSLDVKVIHEIPLLLKFKIDQKVFSFKPDFINKSCRVILLDSNKSSLVIFGFFYTFL
jgi:hypothetical protein